MEQKYITYSATQTKNLGKRISQKILKSKDAVVISLKGELGSGKTT